MAGILIGKTYEYEPGPGSINRLRKGRKALVIAHRRSDLWDIVWPNGMTTTVVARELKGPVEAAKPGVDEPCLICGDSRWVKIYEQDPNRDWVSYVVGAAPCENCSAPGAAWTETTAAQ